ncbi:XK-related protein 8-like [Trichomycterus rosablanca]|uniref:XK-related protein 8-like n=1 Tax=Trichomycterus rosablanca TaxID=2290929 RepID=UPI002F35D5D0
MEEGTPFMLRPSDSLLSVLSLLLYLLDVALDAWAVVSLAQEEEYVLMALLIVLLLGSSVLLQVFSWTWYSESAGDLTTSVEKFTQRRGLMTPLHVLQLGVFLRFAGLLESSIFSFRQENTFHEGVAVHLSHDLSMLRMFEAFAESAPQLALMMVIVIRSRKLQLFTVVKLLGLLGALTFTMLSYHRNMRAFVPDKLKMGWFSSVVYFLWNLLLIGPRVLCVALFASVLPCYVPAHFLSLWTLLLVWAWWQNTDFMETRAGEWLYRATVALIWYFSWFNVSDGSTKLSGIVYHTFTGFDTALLLGLWFWKRSVESARLGPPLIEPYVLIPAIALVYAAGLVLKLVYYWKCHPNQPPLELVKEPRLEMHACVRVPANLETDSNETETTTPAGEPETTGRRRMRHMAAHFYC